MSSNFNPTYIERLFSTFIEKETIFTQIDFDNVRPLIATNYSSNKDILIKISQNKELRSKLSSPEFIKNVLVKLIDRHDDSIDIQTIEIINSYEESFYTEEVYDSSLTAIHYILLKQPFQIDQPPVIFAFFRRIIDNINITETNKAKYEILYQFIRDSFKDEGFKSCIVTFKFYYLYQGKTNLVLADGVEVQNNIVTFISTKSPNDIIESVKAIIDVNTFFSHQIYLEELTKRVKQDFGFIAPFYEYVNDTAKQNWIEWCLPITSKQSIDDFIRPFDNIIESIPNRIQLADKILSESSRHGGVEDKRKLLNAFSRLKLESSNYDYSKYKSQIVNLFVSNDINLHHVGFENIVVNKGLFNNEEIKEIAIKGTDVFFTNIMDLHQVFANILTNLYSEKGYVNDIWNKYKNNIVNLFSNGVLYFFDSFYEKLNDNNKDDLLISSVKETYSIVNPNIIELYRKITPLLTNNTTNQIKGEIEQMVISLFNSDYESSLLVGSQLYSNIGELKNWDENTVNKLWEIYQNGEVEESIKGALKSIFKIDGTEFLIKEANYFTEKASIDVKEALENRKKGNVLIARASNELNGDPEHGTRKKLIVKYEIGKGKTIEKEYQEGDLISIP